MVHDPERAALEIARLAGQRSGDHVAIDQRAGRGVAVRPGADRGAAERTAQEQRQLRGGYAHGTRAILVYVGIPNPDQTLRGGMFATGRIALSAGTTVLNVAGALHAS